MGRRPPRAVYGSRAGVSPAFPGMPGVAATGRNRWTRFRRLPGYISTRCGHAEGIRAHGPYRAQGGAMLVLFLSDSYRPYVSGVVVSAELTGRELARQGHRVLLAAPGPALWPARLAGRHACPADANPSDGGTFRVVSLPSIPVVGVPRFRAPLPLMGPILHALKQEGIPQVLHTHSPFVAGSLGLRLRARLGVPLVFTHHTMYHLYAHYGRLPEPLVRRWTLSRVARFCRQVDAVVAPSPSVARLVREQYGVDTPVHVIPTGLPLEPYHSAPRQPVRQRLGIGEDAPVLLYAGRLAREKNVPVLLETMQRVLHALPQAHGLVVGGGPLEGWLRRQVAASGLGDRLHVVGAVAPEQMPAWYGAADLFVTASVTETQGLVAVEAMACGLPVVAADGPGLRDVVVDGRCGLLVAAHPHLLAEACLRLLTRPSLRKAMAQQARQQAERYDIRRTTGQLLALYRELAQRPRTGVAPAGQRGG